MLSCNCQTRWLAAMDNWAITMAANEVMTYGAAMSHKQICLQIASTYLLHM